MSGNRINPYTETKSMLELAEHLIAESPGRPNGHCPTYPVLVCAVPGAGKTWSSIQLTHEMARQCTPQAGGVCSLPALVYVQRLAQMLHPLLEKCESTQQPIDLDVSVLVQYFVREFGADSVWAQAVAQALQMRTLVLVLDGIDEAAGLRDVHLAIANPALLGSAV